MKKAALTIGLFSLVVVATSFANLETQTLASKDTVSPIDGGAAGGVLKKQDRFAFTAPIDGGAAGGVLKKQDRFAFTAPIDGGAAGGVLKKHDLALNTNLSKNVNFASVNQSVGYDKKID